MTVRISYLVPVHNEEGVLASTARVVVERLSVHPGSELVMVENGSTDRSPDLVEELAKELATDQVGVVAAHSAKGYGNAMCHGIDLATGDLLVITAADLPFGFSDLDAALALAPRARLMIGSKAHPRSRVAITAKRRAMSAAFRLLRLVVIGLRVGDSQGTILVDAGLARTVRPHLRAGDFFFSTELIAFASRMGATPVELPVDYSNPRPSSTVKPLQDGLRMARALLDLRRRLRALPATVP
jgi:glycosyltransferase involved in cell wall biosynthesis